jgi:hypothetical protein
MSGIIVRVAQEDDVKVGSEVIYKAFLKFSTSVGLTPEFKTPEAAEDLVRDFVQNPERAYAVVAVNTGTVQYTTSLYFQKQTLLSESTFLIVAIMWQLLGLWQ